MKIETLYSVGQRLFILGLENRPCVCTEVIVCRGGVLYNVEYWNDGVIQAVKLWEDEVGDKPMGEKVVGIL